MADALVTRLTDERLEELADVHDVSEARLTGCPCERCDLARALRELQSLRATLAAVREFPDTVRTLLKLECGDDGFVFWTDAERVVRHHLLAMLDGAAPEE